jgi:hypothetical protein
MKKKYYLYHWRGDVKNYLHLIPFDFDPETNIVEVAPEEILELSDRFSVMIRSHMKEKKTKKKPEVWDDVQDIYLDEKGWKFQQR